MLKNGCRLVRLVPHGTDHAVDVALLGKVCSGGYGSSSSRRNADSIWAPRKPGPCAPTATVGRSPRTVARCASYLVGSSSRGLRALLEHVEQPTDMVTVVMGQEQPPNVCRVDELEGALKKGLAGNRHPSVDYDWLRRANHHRVHRRDTPAHPFAENQADQEGLGCDGLGRQEAGGLCISSVLWIDGVMGAPEWAAAQLVAHWHSVLKALRGSHARTLRQDRGPNKRPADAGSRGAMFSARYRP